MEIEANTESIKSIKPQLIKINNNEFYRSHHGAYEFILPSKYTTKELIGYGSFGAVVEAYDSVNKRVVAIKKIQNLKDDVDLKRVLREIVILKNLKHDNIITLYDVIYIKK
jgi:serine/threonine protein kinase